MIQTISTPLCEPMPINNPILKIVLNVTISKSGFYAFSKYSNDYGDYIGVNPNPRILIQYAGKDIAWDKHHQIIITPRNIFQLRMGLRTFYRNFQREDLYEYKDGIVDTIHLEPGDVVILDFGSTQLLRIVPDIVTDRTNIRYPGVRLTINREENQVPLSIEEFECLYDILTTVNIQQLGLTLLQTYAIMRKVPVEQSIDHMNAKNKPVKTNNIGRSGSIYEKRDMESCTGPPKMNQPKTLEDL